MMEKDLTNLLERTKDAPEMGGRFDVDKEWNALATDLGFQRGEGASYGWRDYLEYAGWLAGNRLARPVAVGFASFALIFGGWITSVNASFDSVPGDMLYPLKLATERIQLSFAQNDRRAKLHTEFAGRRLREATELSRATQSPENDARVREAFAEFRKEIASAKQRLSEITDPSAAADVAVVLNEQADEAEESLAASSEEGGEDRDESVKGAVEEAIASAEDAAADTVDTLVHSHETTAGEKTGHELQREFQEEVRELQDRVAYAFGRLAMLEEIEAVQADHRDAVSEARGALVGHDRMIAEAMNALAIGGYRSGFETLAELSTRLDGAEQAILDIELALTTPDEPDEPEP